jgi:plastocyanin
MHYSLVAIAAGALALTMIGGAQAAEVEVKMLNHGTAGAYVFEPDLVRIQPGDSVHFVAAD